MFMCFGIKAHSQVTGGYTPYSIYGIGDLSSPGSAYHKTMGGVGIASRNNRHINIINPAAVTARDSLSMMIDVSLYSDNKIFSQGGLKSSSNIVNINDLVISFPILRKSTGFMVGIMPYSDTGFGYSTSVDDPSLIGHTGNISFSATGKGSIYKGFLGAGVDLWKRLSLGAQADFYFGKVEKNYLTKFSDNSFNGVTSDVIMNVSGFGGKFGLQYEQPIGSSIVLGLGATYTLGSNLRGTVENGTYSSGSESSDTLSHSLVNLGANSRIKIANEVGAGISLKYADRLTVEFDYTRADWRNSGINDIQGLSINGGMFQTAVADSYRLGLEYVPNRSDIRYYMKQVSYRAGAYYKNEYYICNGQNVSAKGITIGATFPVFRWSNGITVGADLGQRSSLRNDLVKEFYFNFSLGFNLYDIWFQKSEYK